MIKFLFYLFLLVLTGCAVGPEHMGLSKNEWKNLDPEKRAQLETNYADYKSDHQVINKVYQGPALQVYLAEGSAQMPPKFQRFSFDTATFLIKPGECTKTLLESIDTNNKTYLETCYDGLTFLIDPSHFERNKRLGSVRFDYNPIWKRGFSYTGVSSSGYVRLKHTSITIKAYHNKAPEVVEGTTPAPMPKATSNNFDNNTEPYSPYTDISRNKAKSHIFNMTMQDQTLHNVTKPTFETSPKSMEKKVYLEAGV